MRKDSRSPGWMFKYLAALGLLLSAVVAPKEARAIADLDRKYALETIGYLRSWDNVDGLFAEYVASAYKDYFSRQTRFVLNDLSKGDAILTGSKLPYVKVIEDAEILGQLTRATKTQSLIRTKVQKEGPRYRVSLTWLHAPGMDTLAAEEFFLDDKRSGGGFSFDEIRGGLQSALDRMIAKLPFKAMVTGRDNASLTVNLGTSSGLKPGDTLVIGTIDEAKRHPLLKEIVDWRMTATGKAIVEQTEDGIAFARVEEEESGRNISRYQKIIQVIPRPSGGDKPEIVHEKDQLTTLDDPPTLGWAGVSLGFGSYSRQFSSLTATDAREGGGTAIVLSGEGQLWLTREWFAEMRLGYGFWGYSHNSVSTGAETLSGGSGSLFQFKLAAGYNYLVTGDFFGPKGWAKFGLRSNSYSLPINTTEFTAPTSFFAPFGGLGAEIPLRGPYGLLLDLEFGLITSGSETGAPNGSTNSASDVGIKIGGYWQLKPRMVIRAVFQIQANNIDFSTGATASQKVLTFSPSLVYYF